MSATANGFDLIEPNEMKKESKFKKQLRRFSTANVFHNHERKYKKQLKKSMSTGNEPILVQIGYDYQKQNSISSDESSYEDFEDSSQGDHDTKSIHSILRVDLDESTNKTNNNTNSNSNTNDTSTTSNIENTVITVPLLDNVKCSCRSHPNREVLDRVFDLDLDTVFKCLFTRSAALVRFWQEKKFRNVQAGDWNEATNKRVQTCELDLGSIGVSKNHEEQTMLENRPKQCIVIESETNLTGVPYSDHFSTIRRVCMTRVTAGTTRVLVHMRVNWKKHPNFVIKSIIEKTSFNNIKDCYNFMEKALLELDPSSDLSAPPPIIAVQKQRVLESSINSQNQADAVTTSLIDDNHQSRLESSPSDKSNTPTSSSSDTVESLPQQQNHPNLLINFSSSSNSSVPPPSPSPSPPVLPQSVSMSTSSSSVSIDVYLVKFFNWRIRQETLFKIVFFLFMILVAINVRLYLILLVTENRSQNCGKDVQMINCQSCQQNLITTWRSFMANKKDSNSYFESFLNEWERNSKNV